MIQSLKKNKYGILLMILSSVLVCFGQYFWKIKDQGLIFLFIGFILYGFGALVMLVAYKFGSLSVLQPILSLNFVFALLISYFLLKEDITVWDIVGIIVVIGGVTLIAGGDSSKEAKKEDTLETEVTE